MKTGDHPGGNCPEQGCDTQWKPSALPSVRRQKLDALPDPVDFRDRLYEPTLVEVPSKIELSTYRALGVPILDQGTEGACTGFALATVAHYLLRRRKVYPDSTVISARMFYELAKRYDAFPGEDYDGSSARGAVKGWFKHGVCPEALWPSTSSNGVDRALTLERAQAAKKYPLGAYYRVDSKNIVAMHSALAEVGILYVSAAVHSGWQNVAEDGQIRRAGEIIGGHAFALVAFDSDGFWLQNSWGTDWGLDGYGHISYDDWLENGSDVWVVRLGAEVHSNQALQYDQSPSAAGFIGDTYCNLRPHIISLGNDGELCRTGIFANDENVIREILHKDFPRITQGWKSKRICIYAHGGLVSENQAIAKLNRWRAQLLEREIYPIFLMWHTDLLSTITGILEDTLKLPNLACKTTFDLCSRFDDLIEPFARLIGESLWSEMKENALASSVSVRGGARFLCDTIAEVVRGIDIELSFVGHSAGAVLLAPLMYYLCGEGVIPDGPLQNRIARGLRAQSLTLWAPACTLKLFHQTFGRLISHHRVEHFALFTLDEETERAEQCGLYHKSLLYLVSNAFEEQPRAPWSSTPGTPLLGLAESLRGDTAFIDMLSKQPNEVEWILCPNQLPLGDCSASRTRKHGEFDYDECTLHATLNRILQPRPLASS